MSIRSVILAICVARAPVIAHALGLVRFDFREVTSCHDYDEHEKDKNDHHVEAKLAAHLNFTRNTSTIGALVAHAFRSTLTLVKILFHALLTDFCAARAIAEGTARFKTAIQVSCARLHALNDG